MVSPLIERLTTCVVGGGNSAHVLVPFLSEARHSVNLLTRRPQDWNHDSITCQLTDGTTGQVAATHVGMLAACSANPADVVPNADIVILCMPVHSYREALDRIAPYLSRSKSHVYVGTVCSSRVTRRFPDHLYSHLPRPSRCTAKLDSIGWSMPWNESSA
jgi:prephenate dehydrogenase